MHIQTSRQNGRFNSRLRRRHSAVVSVLHLFHPSPLDHPVLWRCRVPRVRAVMLLTFVSEHGPVIWPLPAHAGPPSAVLVLLISVYTNACLLAGVHFGGVAGVSALSCSGDMETRPRRPCPCSPVACALSRGHSVQLGSGSAGCRLSKHTHTGSLKVAGHACESAEPTLT